MCTEDMVEFNGLVELSVIELTVLNVLAYHPNYADTTCVVVMLDQLSLFLFH